MGRGSQTVAPSRTPLAARSVRLFTGRKVKGCGMVRGGSIVFAVFLLLLAAYFLAGLIFQIAMLVMSAGRYHWSYRPTLRDVLLNIVAPAALFLFSLTGGLWLIAAGASLVGFVRHQAENNGLAAMLIRRSKATRQDERGSGDADHLRMRAAARD
jgi:hypothetical protein